MTIDGLPNFRDTGGTPLSGGGETRAGVLFRSAALSGLTPLGAEQLAETAIGVIVDFRTTFERDSAPDVLPSQRSFRVVDMPLLQGAATGLSAAAANVDRDLIARALTALPSLGDVYVSMLGDGRATFAATARLVAASVDEEPTAVLVHCSAGKDRTGVATALMLDAAGGDRDAIIADYASSQERLKGAWAEGVLARVEAMGVPLTPAIRTLLTATPPAAIEQAFDWIDRTHGSSEAYLRDAGLTDAELDSMQTRLRA